MEVGEPTLVQALRLHRGEVSCVDACGAWLVSGGGDRALRLWHWTGGTGWQETAAAAGAHRYGVTVARWAGAGALLASGGVDGDVRLWCGRTLAARRVLAAPGATAVRAICWTGGATRLAAGHDDGALCVWGAARGMLLARLLAHEGSLHAVALPARGALLLTACTHGVLKVFDFAEVCESGEAEGAPPAPLMWVDGAHDLGALCADASADGSLAATGGHDALVRVWCVGAGRAVSACGSLEGHSAAVTALRWAARGAGGGAVLASASLDRTARLWAAGAGADGACLCVLKAHPRYLTCVALEPDLAYLITGSNDKSVRTWSLGEFSVGTELEPECTALAHFALGDLEGIGPVDEPDEPDEGLASRGGEGEGEGGALLAAALPGAHSGAVNCVAVYRHLLATASSDGVVKVWRWEEGAGGAGDVVLEHALPGHEYPVLAAEFSAGGQVLLTAGLDGGAYVWDVQTGVLLRSLRVPSGQGGAAGAVGGEAGGGGVRGACVSPHRPPLLLLATDDGVAPLWELTAASPAPAHVYAGHAEAVTCCAWAADGRAAATGAASGELRVHAPPPRAATLHHESEAHDLGVQSCDFAPVASSLDLAVGTHLLATGGCDSLVKLWLVELNEVGDSAEVRCVRQWEAHGGGVTSVRWGAGSAGALLASAGADRWARVWRVAEGGGRVAPHAAVHVQAGALAVALLSRAPDLADLGTGGEEATQEPLLVVGTLGGGLALWRVPAVEEDTQEDDEGAAPRCWRVAGVMRWLREYVARVPGSTMSRDSEAALLQRARDLCLTGAVLLDEPLDRLLADLGYGEECKVEGDAERTKEEMERVWTRECLRAELEWLRRAPAPRHLVREAPHALLCPLTHRLLSEPARAADGFTYDRAAILEWFLAAGAAVSPVSGRRLHNARVLPNYAVRDQLRAFLAQPPPAP